MPVRLPVDKVGKRLPYWLSRCPTRCR